MSGLAVLFQRDGPPVDPRAVRAMLDAVPYRGPDGSRVRLFGPVGLGHAKMAVTPEDAGEWQPHTSPRTGCAVIADARVDNRDELLALLPDAPPDVGDGELILRAYERWDLGAFARLLGDFAVAIWDPREQRIVCARDASGMRALFYRCDARSFAAASEIHQLLQDPAVPIEPNEEHVLDFLVPYYMLPDERQHHATFFVGIWLLPAGHCLIVDGEGPRLQRYWDFELERELRYRDEEEYAEHYRELLFAAAGARLRAAGPLGLLLSGGLDSSSVACVAHELYRSGRAQDRGFTSFTATFDGLACDERELVHAVQAKYGFAAEFLPFEEGVGRLQLQPTGFREGPSGGDVPLPSVFAAAGSRGIRVILTGTRGDLCVGGSPLVFDSLLRRGRLVEWWRRLAAHRTVSRDSLRKILALDCFAPLLALGLQRWLRAAQVRREFERNRAYLLPAWMPAALRDELAQRHLRLSLERERERRFSSPARDEEYRFLYPPLTERHPAPWSVELWDPFSDRRLHEFVLAIPPEQHFGIYRRGEHFYAAEKRLARRALRGILPDAIRSRTSPTIFDGAVAGAIERDWPSYEAAFRPPARSRIAERGYVDADAFWSALQEVRAGRQGRDLFYVEGLAGLESWLRALELPRERFARLPEPSCRVTTAVTREMEAATASS